MIAKKIQESLEEHLENIKMTTKEIYVYPTNRPNQRIAYNLYPM